MDVRMLALALLVGSLVAAGLAFIGSRSKSPKTRLICGFGGAAMVVALFVGGIVASPPRADARPTVVFR